MKPDIGADTHESPGRPDVVAVLDAYRDLKAAMSNKTSRGGIPVAPVNRAAEVYGPRYTQEQFRELAIRTGLEGQGYDAEEVARRVPGLLELFELLSSRGGDPHIGAVN